MPCTTFDICRRVKDIASFLMYMIIQVGSTSPLYSIVTNIIRFLSWFDGRVTSHSFVGRCDQFYLQISLRYLHIPGPLKLKLQSVNFTNESIVWFLGGSSNVYHGRLRDTPVAIRVLRMYKKDKATTVIRVSPSSVCESRTTTLTLSFRTAFESS